MRVLVVEDDRALARVITRGLAEEGHAVDVAHTVREARVVLDTAEVSLIVLDIGLPDGNGVDFCREIRAGGDQVAILMLTARDGVAERIVGLDAGADDYLPKPFDFGELCARVRALLRRPVIVRAPRISVGALDIDSTTRRVTVDGETVPLTTREFSLLLHLANQADEVVSRSELLDALWDTNYDGLSNVVDVHVRNLRRKLDRPGYTLPLETIRGAGYRFRSDDVGRDVSGDDINDDAANDAANDAVTEVNDAVNVPSTQLSGA